MITSTNNTQLKRIVQLNTKAKVRREEQLFVAEGRKLLEETPEALRRQVFVSETFEREHRDTLLAGINYEVVADRIFPQICDTKTPQGVVTVVRMPQYTLFDLMGKQGETPLLMVLEDLQDPGNVGTILRTAEGAGVTGILMSNKTADVFQPKVIRSTMGSIFRVPFLRVEDVVETVRTLKQSGVTTYAAHLAGTNTYDRESYRDASAFLIGNEGNGLTDALTAEADIRIRIPMEGQVESLNAAIASALLMYEAHNQRRQ